MKLKSDVPSSPCPIAPPRSKVWRDTFANALAKGATPEQAARLADATYKGWKK